MMLGLSPEDGKKNVHIPVIDKIDSRFISRKLKKYQPSNSSFSLFYGEKKSLEKLKADEECEEGG